MSNPDTMAAVRRIFSTLLGMGQTRLELATVEITQAMQSFIHTLTWSLLAALSASLASVFVCFAVVAVYWDTTYRLSAILMCAGLYLLMAIWFFLRVKQVVGKQGPLLEATIAEFERDKLALLDSVDDFPAKSNERPKAYRQ